MPSSQCSVLLVLLSLPAAAVAAALSFLLSPLLYRRCRRVDIHQRHVLLRSSLAGVCIIRSMQRSLPRLAAAGRSSLLSRLQHSGAFASRSRCLSSLAPPPPSSPSSSTAASAPSCAPEPSPSAPPGGRSSPSPSPSPPAASQSSAAASFLDTKAALHERELSLHRPDRFPQSLSSLAEYEQVEAAAAAERDAARLGREEEAVFSYRHLDVGHELRFDPLHPPVLPRVDAKEVGPGGWDGLLEQSIAEPERRLDSTGRTQVRSLQLLEGVGYVTAARACAAVLVSVLSASQDVLATGSLDVAVDRIPEGSTQTVRWRGRPVFIRHRTAWEIAAARRDDELAAAGRLRDPELDSERVKRDDFLIVIGICTHLGCVPISAAGDWKGFFCPCHGSHYDTSGRVRKGPAPLNLAVPPYDFIAPGKVRLGTEK